MRPRGRVVLEVISLQDIPSSKSLHVHSRQFAPNQFQTKPSLLVRHLTRHPLARILLKQLPQLVRLRASKVSKHISPRACFPPRSQRHRTWKPGKGTHHLLIPLPNLRTIGIDVMARHLPHLPLRCREALVDVVIAALD